MKTLLYVLSVILIFPVLACAKVDESGNPNDANFNVMTYNIRMNTPDDGINAWPLRKNKVLGLLKFHEPDIFGIQEALPEQMADLEAGLPNFNHVGVGRDDGISKGEHMSVFYRKSRFEKLASGTFWLSTTPDKPGLGWDAACNRTCTWLKMRDKMTQKMFFFFNTHFDHKGSVARIESAKLVLQFINEFNKEGLPCILTGDFNSTKENEPIQIILKELIDSRVISETEPYGPEGTSGGFDVKVMPRTIDYIFVNSKIRVLKYGVISDSFGLYHPSDHLPVFTQIQVR